MGVTIRACWCENSKLHWNSSLLAEAVLEGESPRASGPPPGHCPWTPPGALKWAPELATVTRSGICDELILTTWIQSTVSI